MLNRDLVRVKHMFDGVEEILRFTQGKKRIDLDNDRLLSLALVHLFEIIGEAANKVTPEFRAKYSQIPWKSIVEMRNRLIHGYYDIDLNIVWITVVNEIPSLHRELGSIIGIEESPDEKTSR
jgi:uncharacterized protein with HEPN domain